MAPCSARFHCGLIAYYVHNYICDDHLTSDADDDESRKAVRGQGGQWPCCGRASKHSVPPEYPPPPFFHYIFIPSRYFKPVPLHNAYFEQLDSSVYNIKWIFFLEFLLGPFIKVVL